MKPDLQCTRLLLDDELICHLEQRRTLLFKGLGTEWHIIEKQVDRLGFGELYAVSQVGSRECSAKVTPVLVAAQPNGLAGSGILPAPSCGAFAGQIQPA